jgi:hypothetical protein
MAKSAHSSNWCVKSQEPFRAEAHARINGRDSPIPLSLWSYVMDSLLILIHIDQTVRERCTEGHATEGSSEHLFNYIIITRI